MQIADIASLIILFFVPILYFKLARLEGLLLGSEPVDPTPLKTQILKPFLTQARRKPKVNDDEMALKREMSD